MNLKDNFWNPKLHFVTGKGGVGKTTLCVILSLLAKELGKKVLLIELDPQGPISFLFNSPKLHFTPQKMSQNIDGILITSRLSLREYIIQQVKFSKIYDLLFDNKVMRFFFDACPGIEEIAILGKIFYLAKDSKWDTLIIDAPATGHGLYLFKTPKVFLDIARIGPIADRSSQIYKMLTDTHVSAIHLITIPEELPIQETIELHEEIKKLELPFGEIFLNKMLAPPPSNIVCLQKMSGLIQKIENSLLKYQIRFEIQEQYKKTLQKALKCPLISMPWILKDELTLSTLKQNFLPTRGVPAHGAPAHGEDPWVV